MCELAYLKSNLRCNHDVIETQLRNRQFEKNDSHNLSRYINKEKDTVEKSRPRINLDGSDVTVNPTGLIEMQLSSYADFLQRFVAADDRELRGLHAAFHSVFPISAQMSISFLSIWVMKLVKRLMMLTVV